MQTRLDLWLKTHIEKLLGPMFELSKAEDVTGIARGIAFQLVEALGVLERNKIAAEMKDLDQPSRAILRKYGVRFGAYHIYFPGLLKPAARALAALLWALKQDDVDMAVLSGAQHLASSGRTSFPVDKTARPRCLSRARLPPGGRARGARRYPGAARRSDPSGAGLARKLVRRQAGRRVRWPQLRGDAGHDLAHRLGRRGFRLDPARARLSHGPPPALAAEAGCCGNAGCGSGATGRAEATAAGATEATDTSAEAASADAPAEAAAEAPAEATAEVVDQHVSGDPAPSAALLPEVTPLATSEETPVVVEAAPEPVAETEAPVEPAAPEPAAEATWMPKLSSLQRLPQRPPSPRWSRSGAPVAVRRSAGRGMSAVAAIATRAGRKAKAQDGAAAAADGKPAEGAKRERHRHHGRRDFRKPQDNAPAANAPAAPADAAATAAPADGAPAREQRQDQRGDRRERFEGKGRDRDNNKREKFGDRQGNRRDERDRGRDRDKGRDKRDREGGPALRHYASSSNPRERERAADPNSPFAKLAALKEQLAGNRKE